jgi:polar amino acid transport system substrate-binding protein
MAKSVLAIVLAALCLSALTAVEGADDSLERVVKSGKLVWGADQEGGGPFVYAKDDDPNTLIGFEVELADLIAAKLGVKAQFSQGQWEKLPDVLDRGDIDIVLNGYEWSPARADQYATSRPYYIYELQLLARKDDAALNEWDDLETLENGDKRRVVVLGGSAAEAYVNEHLADKVEIVRIDGITDAMRAVELHSDGIDANLQDSPIVTFYLQGGFPGLKKVGQPVGKGYYIAMARKADVALITRINEILREARVDGSLRKIYDKYGLWNATQETQALDLDPGKTIGPNAFQATRGWAAIQKYTPFLLRGAWVTVLLSLTSMPLAILAGMMIAICRLYGPPPLRSLATLYVELVRGTPLVLQLYTIYFVLPEIHIKLSAFTSSVLGLAINYSAYEAEIYRAGLQAIPKGQWEAATSLGMSRWLTLRRVIIPQATRIVIPPMTNDFIALFKDTAVCSLITMVELSKEYYIHARSSNAVIELGVVTAVLYLMMSYPLSKLATYLEHRLQKAPH